MGIDKSSIFLDKTNESVKNIWQLYEQNKINANDFKILKTFNRIQRIKMIKIFRTVFKKYAAVMGKNLVSDNPNLFIYDLYKLGYLCSLSLKEK